MEVTVLFVFGRGEAGKGRNSEASFPKAMICGPSCHPSPPRCVYLPLAFQVV